MPARNCRRLNFKPDRRTPPKNVGLLELDRARHERDWKPSVEELKKDIRGWQQRGCLRDMANCFLTGGT
jgi:hypothetical protein